MQKHILSFLKSIQVKKYIQTFQLKGFLRAHLSGGQQGNSCSRVLGQTMEKLMRIVIPQGLRLYVWGLRQPLQRGLRMNTCMTFFEWLVRKQSQGGGGQKLLHESRPGSKWPKTRTFNLRLRKYKFESLWNIWINYIASYTHTHTHLYIFYFNH